MGGVVLLRDLLPEFQPGALVGVVPPDECHGLGAVLGARRRQRARHEHGDTRNDDPGDCERLPMSHEVDPSLHRPGRRRPVCPRLACASSRRESDRLENVLSTVFENDCEMVYTRRVSDRRVTIGDVAAEAGVSVATVSKVVNDRWGVAETTSQRVRAVIEQLGYQSSLVAQGLRSRSTERDRRSRRRYRAVQRRAAEGRRARDRRLRLRARRLLRAVGAPPTRSAGSAGISRGSAGRCATARSSSPRAASM